MTTFALDLSKQIEAAKAKAELVAKKTMIELFNRVIEKSPVGNPDLWQHPVKGYVGGRFRANWNCSIGSPNFSTTESIDPSGNATASKATSVVMSYTLNDQSVYLTNSLPYAIRLEEGWSGQAPNGMVRLSVMEVQNSVR